MLTDRWSRKPKLNKNRELSTTPNIVVVNIIIIYIVPKVILLKEKNGKE